MHPPAAIASGETDIFALAVELRARRTPFVLATVTAARGSTSARPGAKALIDPEGRIIAGWVGGGCAESTVAHAALECLSSGETQIVDLDLDDEVLGTGMPCGGTMQVYVEPFLPRPTLWILGHGRIAECLCSLGAMMGLEVVIDDPLASAARFPDARRLIVDDPVYAQLTPAADDFVVVATQHKGDHESLLRVLSTDTAYVALIASHKRTRLVLQYLRDAGVDEDRLRRVRAPAGLDLGARTPEEVALAIMSEIVRVRRKGASATDRDADAALPEHPAAGGKTPRTFALSA